MSIFPACGSSVGRQMREVSKLGIDQKAFLFLLVVAYFLR